MQAQLGTGSAQLIGGANYTVGFRFGVWQTRMPRPVGGNSVPISVHYLMFVRENAECM